MSIAIVFSFLHTSPMLHVKMCTFHFLFGLKKPHQLPFPLVNPQEGKRQDASPPEGRYSPAECPSPAPSYRGSGRGPYCFISLWWLRPPMPSRGMWSHKRMVLGWILVSTPWFSH